ncbi:MAG: DUF72 domain-containing protein [Gemmatimonadota bacterium]
MNSRRAPDADQDFFADDDAAEAAVGDVTPAQFTEDLIRLGHRLPAGVFLGTSSWSFPGWQGIVYGGAFTEAQLARTGLAAYAQHPLLRTVGIDRSFYQPLGVDEYARYAQRVPEQFRFVVKAPAQVTDAVMRAGNGMPEAPNPHFLDADLASARFVQPAIAGLGDKAGPLVFQLAPLPRALLQGAGQLHALVERIGEFLARLPTQIDGIRPVYAIEPRNGELLTPRLVRTLREVGARLCVSIHARMPEASRQSTALRVMDAIADEGDEWRMKGPLVVRWNLHAGLRYDEARHRYAPFDRLLDADIVTRGTLAHLIHVAIRSGQPAFVIANNKAEGSAPLSCVELARAVVAR